MKNIDSLNVPKEVKAVLKIFHEHANVLKMEPSQKDLKTLDIGNTIGSLYYSP